MRRLDQRETRLHIECGLERHPGEDPGIVKLAQRLDPIARQRGVAFPFFREAVVEACQRAGEGIAFGPEEVEIAQRVPPLVNVQIASCRRGDRDRT